MVPSRFDQCIDYLGWLVIAELLGSQQQSIHRDIQFRACHEMFLDLCLLEPKLTRQAGLKEACMGYGRLSWVMPLGPKKHVEYGTQIVGHNYHFI